MYIHNEEVFDGVLWRTFWRAENTPLSGHPYTTQHEEIGADGWYAVIRQDVPEPAYLNPPEIAAVADQDLWRAGPFQYRWQAKEAAWRKDADVCAAHWHAYHMRFGYGQAVADQFAADLIKRAHETIERTFRPVWNATSGRKAAQWRAFWWAER